MKKKQDVYYREYELLIDLPTGEKKGDHFFDTTINGNICYERGELSDFTTRKNKWYPDWSLNKDNKNRTIFTLDQMTEQFFKPIGKPIPLYPKFPSMKKFEDVFYRLEIENKLVEDVDEIRCINPIIESKEFKNKVYNLIKEMYNKKYFNK